MTTPDILVRSHMWPVRHQFHPKMSVEEVVEIITNNNIMGAPVIDDDKKLMGFITEQDCMKQMLNSSYYSEDHQLAEEIMRTPACYVSPNTDILDLAQDMLGQKPKLYPVVENNEVIGIISRADVLKFLEKSRVEPSHG